MVKLSCLGSTSFWQQDHLELLYALSLSNIEINVLVTIAPQAHTFECLIAMESPVQEKEVYWSQQI